jgi:formamidopyrimidine-DNA glycosylase
VPELPDVTIYLERLAALTAGATLDRVALQSPFLLRTVEPPLAATFGKRVTGVRRIGKRIAILLDDVALVIHLMIAGRLHWNPKSAARAIATFTFSTGTLTLTEAGSKKRASLHVVFASDLAALQRGGLEPLGASLEQFALALRRENHTVKRALTDPTLFSGIGNAYSDEILHRARISPLRLTARMDDAEIARLHAATQQTLELWIGRLRAECGTGFPEKVTAFRKDMAVHGRHGKPCPDCGRPVQRIRYAENECNYCAQCQTGGVILADRALSRLLREDWPRTFEELEERRGRRER